MGRGGKVKIGAAVCEMFERLGVKQLEAWTRPMSFMGVYVSSFKPAKKDNLSNRSQSDWKKAEYVVVEDCVKEDEAIILEVWKQITSRDPDAPYKIQKILIKTSNDQYDLYDYDANKIASGSLEEIENFIRINNLQLQSKQLLAQDRLTVALRLFKDAVAAGEVASAIDNVYLDDVTSGENALQDEGTPSSALTDEGGTFEAEVKKSPKLFAHYLENPPEGYVNQFTELTKVLVSIRPADYTACTEEVLRALKFLELTKVKALPEPLTADAYESSKAIQTQIRDKMREMKILSQEGKEANYLTVAEFLWFVNDNKDLIEGKVMEKQFKSVNTTKVKEDSRNEKCLECNTTDDVLIFRLMAALRTKPFAILAGHSGTGKSRLVRKLAYMTCNVEELQNTEKNSPENFWGLIYNVSQTRINQNWNKNT